MYAIRSYYELGGSSPLSIGRLTVTAGASATMAGPVSVTDLLTLAGGNITTGPDTLAVVSSAAVTRTSGGVEGNLRKHVPAGLFV